MTEQEKRRERAAQRILPYVTLCQPAEAQEKYVEPRLDTKALLELSRQLNT